MPRRRGRQRTPGLNVLELLLSEPQLVAPPRSLGSKARLYPRSLGSTPGPKAPPQDPEAPLRGSPGDPRALRRSSFPVPGLPCAAPSRTPGAGASLYLCGDHVRWPIGLDAELFFIRELILLGTTSILSPVSTQRNRCPAFHVACRVQVEYKQVSK